MCARTRGHDAPPMRTILSSRWAFTTSWAISFTIFLLAARPGWLSNDSIAMFAGAKGGEIGDWYSPFLTYIWSALWPQTLGPWLPFLLQSSAFWVGLFLVGAWLYALGFHRAACALFPLVFLSSTLWTVGWLWKDAAIVSLLVLAFGIAAFGTVWHRGRFRTLSTICSTVLLSVAACITWFALPALVFGAFALAYFPVFTPGQAQRRPLAIVALIVGIFAGVLGAWSIYQAAIVKPGSRYAIVMPLMLDIARAECVVGTPADRREGRSLFPPSLIRGADSGDICANFNPFDSTPMFTYRLDAPWIPVPQQTEMDGYAAPGVPASYFVEPKSDAELSELRSYWWRALKAHPSLIFQGKARQAVKFLVSETGLWWTPSAQLLGRYEFDRPDGFGQGADAGWPSRGGALLAFASIPAGLTTEALLGFGSKLSGLLWLLLVPIAVLVVAYRARSIPRLGLLLGAGFPLVWLVNYAAIAPAADIRYVAPGIVWSQCLLVLTLGLVAYTRQNRPSADQLERTQSITESPGSAP